MYEMVGIALIWKGFLLVSHSPLLKSPNQDWKLPEMLPSSKYRE